MKGKEMKGALRTAGRKTFVPTYAHTSTTLYNTEIDTYLKEKSERIGTLRPTVKCQRRVIRREHLIG